MGINSKPLSISEKPKIINTVDVVPNLPCTKTAEPLYIPVRKAIEKCLDSHKQVKMCEVCCKLHKFHIHIQQVLKKI